MQARAAAMEDVASKLQAHEKTVSKPSAPESVRTLLALNKFGTVCTFASSPSTSGYPSGALLPYAVDDKGRVICALSDLSSHKRCAHARPSCAL